MQLRGFRIDEEWSEDIETAILKAPRRKATGADQVFVEALQVHPTLAAEWLEKVWTKCGTHKIFPTEWSRSVLCPLFKKQPADNPLNWCALTL